MDNFELINLWGRIHISCSDLKEYADKEDFDKFRLEFLRLQDYYYNLKKYYQSQTDKIYCD